MFFSLSATPILRTLCGFLLMTDLLSLLRLGILNLIAYNFTVIHFSLMLTTGELWKHCCQCFTGGAWRLPRRMFFPQQRGPRVGFRHACCPN